eukprot:1159067-Pelagomonas_calceolata.AAC.2
MLSLCTLSQAAPDPTEIPPQDGHSSPTGRQKAKSLASELICHAIQREVAVVNTRHALYFQGASLRGGGWACGDGGREKKSPGVQKHGRKPSRST